MSDKFDKFMQYAFDKSRSITEKFRRKKGEEMDKKDINIESYDGQDAFYTGTDEEYEEFLKNADVKMNDGVDAEPVENTRRINLNETVNIQSVIDKFKKTADGIESGAKKFKDSVVSKVDEFKVKKENSPVFEKVEEIKDELQNAVDESGIKEKVKNSMKNSMDKVEEIKEGIVSVSEMSDRFDDVELKIQNVSEDISSLSKKLNELSDKLNVMEVQCKEQNNDSAKNYSDVKESVQAVGSEVTEIKQAVSAVSRLNDSVFDLKNTQMNTKNVMSDLETSFNRLKKKCVLGVTVLSILSAIIIVLEIVLMLS